MRAVGIIAEYDPFHNGHAYQIAEAKRLCGADACAVVMSGSFVQRGGPACLDKFTRARLAVLGGADIVFELPEVLSGACAERFAYGGVRLLSASGIVSHIAFGSESGDIESVKKLACADLSSSELRELLDSGCSYPKAVSLYLESKGIPPAGPNDTLGAEYIRAVKKLGADIEPVAVKRIGSAHGSDLTDGVSLSSSAIRSLAENGRIDEIEPYVPGSVFPVIKASADSKAGFPATLEALALPVLYRLRTLGNSGIAALADVSEGLENLFYPAAMYSSSIGELLGFVKTKRYTLSRLRRILANALLGTTAELQQHTVKCEDALYIRVLAVRASRAAELLSALSKNASLPVITDVKGSFALNRSARAVFAHSANALSVHSLAFPGSHAAFLSFRDIAVQDV